MWREALDLAEDLSGRSTIKIKVGAVIFNDDKIIAWGWNNPGDGYGDHAEHMAIRRFVSSNYYRRTNNCRIAVYSTRKGRPITSRPCANCEKMLRRYDIKGAVYFRKEEIDGKFVTYRVQEDYV